MHCYFGCPLIPLLESDPEWSAWKKSIEAISSAQTIRIPTASFTHSSAEADVTGSHLPQPPFGLL